MSTIHDTESQTQCEPLLELATPNIYRRNLFRVLGLNTDATPKDVQRQQTRRKMQAKLGVGSSNGQHGLALDPAPTDEDCRAAMERLTQPRDRVLDEVFWFWPVGVVADKDPALKALEQGDTEQARATWMAQTKTPEDGCVATHNLAVLDHLAALDEEARMGASGPDQKEQDRLCDLWLRAFARWKAVLDGEDFWSSVKERVRDLNDMQVPTGFVRRIRGTLPTALLLISAKMACAAAERFDTALAQRHLKLIRETSFGEGLAERAIQEALKPVRTRLKTVMDKAKSGWTSKPQHGNVLVRQMFDQVKSLLAVVDLMLPADNLARGGLHDAAADAMLEGQVAFGRKTDDWPECVKLLELALELAPGEAIRTRLTSNIETLNGNAKSGNDWCSPGYWALPQEVITQMEAARDKSRAGNHEGAIKDLVVLDAGLGAPFRRCVAFSMSQRGLQLVNEGITEFNSKPTAKMQAFLDSIRRLSSIKIPNPHMSSWELPDCPCCSGSRYTRWSSGEYDGQKYWMCGSCAETHERERTALKEKLKATIGEGYGYLLLAGEVDSSDAGLADSIKSIKKVAGDLSCSTPSTKPLKAKYGKKTIRGIQADLSCAAGESNCFFCEAGIPDDACRIMVPMCGGIREISLLFGKNVEYSRGHVSIPRCRRCSDEQHVLPARLAEWQEACVAACDDAHFPEESQAVDAAEGSVRGTVAELERYKRMASEAQAALAKAKAVGSECDRCKSKTSWLNGLCRKCDCQAFNLSIAAKSGVAAITTVALFGAFFLQGNFGIFNWVPPHATWTAMLAAFLVPVVACLATIPALRKPLLRQREKLREQRLVEIQQKTKAAGEDAVRLLHEASGLPAAEVAATKAKEAHEQAGKALQAAKDSALAAFVRETPEPQLPQGIKPESDYTDFNRIKELQSKGWGYGQEVTLDSLKVGVHPINVTGLIALAANGQSKAAPSPYRKVASPLTSTAANLERWKQSGNPEAWVSARSGVWKHDDWLKLLEALKRSAYWPLDEIEIGRVLEQARKPGSPKQPQNIGQAAEAGAPKMLPDIEFDCPHCRTHITVENRGAGLELPCPRCSKQIIIPSA